MPSSRFDRAGASRRPQHVLTAPSLLEVRARRRAAPPGDLHRPFSSIYDAPRFFLGRGRREEKRTSSICRSSRVSRDVGEKSARHRFFPPTRCVKRVLPQFQSQNEKALENRRRASRNGECKNPISAEYYLPGDEARPTFRGERCRRRGPIFCSS